MTFQQKMRLRDWVKKWDVLLITLAFLGISVLLIVLEHRELI